MGHGGALSARDPLYRSRPRGRGGCPVTKDSVQGGEGEVSPGTCACTAATQATTLLPPEPCSPSSRMAFVPSCVLNFRNEGTERCGVKNHGILCPVASFLALPSGNFSCTKNNRKKCNTNDKASHSENSHHTHTLQGSEAAERAPMWACPSLCFLGLGASVLGQDTTTEDGETTVICSISIYNGEREGTTPGSSTRTHAHTRAHHSITPRLPPA